MFRLIPKLPSCWISREDYGCWSEKVYHGEKPKLLTVNGFSVKSDKSQRSNWMDMGNSALLLGPKGFNPQLDIPVPFSRVKVLDNCFALASKRTGQTRQPVSIEHSTRRSCMMTIKRPSLFPLDRFILAFMITRTTTPRFLKTSFPFFTLLEIIAYNNIF